MKPFLVITAFLLLLITGNGYGQDSVRGDDIREVISKYDQAEVSITYPGFEAMTLLASQFSVSSCNGKEAVLCLSPNDVEKFISSGRKYTLIIPEPRKGFYTASSVDEAMLWHSYPTICHYDTIMQRIAEKNPDICLLDTIGYSVLGRAILVLKISDNVNEDEDEPAVMLSASIHGDETGGYVLLMRLADYLVTENGSGTLADELVSGLEIWINPLSNPDGMYRYNDTIISPVRYNINGYDLNRNFPDPEMTSPPEVQIETEGMMAFMEKRHFVLSANLHGGSEVVNYPWDKWARLHADDDWFNDISRRYADTVHLHADEGYMTFLDDGVTRGWVWYVVQGGRQDYITWGLQGREVTIELDDTKMTPGSNLESLWDWNYRSLLNYLAEALYGLRGTVTDSDSGDPLSAKVYIDGYDCDSSHVYSDTLTGKYFRFLAPGIYNITYSCSGYQSQSYEARITDWDTQVIHDVRLEKLLYTYPDPPEKGVLIWPNPSDGNISIMPPSTLAGDVTITVTNTRGVTLKEFSATAEEGVPVVYDLSALTPGMYIITVRKLPDGPVARGKAVIRRFK